jgi:hypothetical protein
VAPDEGQDGLEDLHRHDMMHAYTTGSTLQSFAGANLHLPEMA